MEFLKEVSSTLNFSGAFMKGFVDDFLVSRKQKSRISKINTNQQDYKQLFWVVGIFSPNVA